jgi:hypothetical protein
MGCSSLVKKSNLHENFAKATLSPTRHEIDAHNNVKLSRPPPRHPAAPPRLAQTTNTTFRDHHPDIPPLVIELQRHTTRPPATLAAPTYRPQTTATTQTSGAAAPT